ncbi:TonB-dependent receptor family protein [Ideonella azotifigens]|uniref:TonB-dependent receptor family protein n=2 Tax=Ideonella azotifigens TaxID=513160 RepID=UPI0035C086FE
MPRHLLAGRGALRPNFPRHAGWLLATAPVAVLAQQVTEATPAAPVETVVITATRTEQRAFDVPASIDRIEGDDLRLGRAQVNLSESLGAVPGLQARDRQNYAQDTQISMRGFGARSTFGIRGVRLYVDGIPATLPDGQGQISNVELGSVGHIEVLRGPFSALYGNSAGGVINVFTDDGAGPPRVGFSAGAGSDGARRVGVSASGSEGTLGYVLGASRFTTDGYREHSATERLLGNAKLSWKPDQDRKLTLVLNSVALPRAQDPLGLTRAQYEADPRGVDPVALSFDTRKRMNQTQGGVTYEQRIDPANTLQLMAYLGHRGTEQFQSIPVTTQANPLHPGGVIELSRDYRGGDLRWTHQTEALGGPLSLVAGLAYDTLAEHRQGYQNFTGSGDDTVTGVRGALRRDEHNDVNNLDEYLQASWRFAPSWTLNAGLRHSRVRFESRDDYIVGTNPDDSGGANYTATLPVLGLMFAASEQLHFYATAGRGFETPTLNELAYRSGGQTGLNFGLGAARSSSVEAGVKARVDGLGEFTAALFRTGTSNEIVTQTNQGGRATYQNAGATRRRGLELGWSQRFFGDLRAQVALSTLDARYRDGFATCAATPCSSATLQIPAGNRLPGLARNTAFAAVSWAPLQGWHGGAEARYVSRVFVNDANSDAAPGYATAAVNAGYAVTAGAWQLDGFARIDNLFARRYVGSVIVNEGNSRFFEPAPGRTWWAGVSGSLRF